MMSTPRTDAVMIEWAPCRLCGQRKQTKANEAEAKLARVTAALEKYGQHRVDCPKWKDHDGSIGSFKKFLEIGCTCGLEAALKGDG